MDSGIPARSRNDASARSSNPSCHVRLPRSRRPKIRRPCSSGTLCPSYTGDRSLCSSGSTRSLIWKRVRPSRSNNTQQNIDQDMIFLRYETSRNCNTKWFLFHICTHDCRVWIPGCLRWGEHRNRTCHRNRYVLRWDDIRDCQVCQDRKVSRRDNDREAVSARRKVLDLDDCPEILLPDDQIVPNRNWVA